MNLTRTNGVVVAGTAVHCALGNSVAVCARNLENGLVPVSDTSIFWSGESVSIPWYGIGAMFPENHLDRFNSILDAVVADALKDAALKPDETSSMGVFLGSSSFEIGQSELTYLEELEQFGSDLAMPMRLVSFGNIGAYLRKTFGLNGPDYVFGTACSASANAILGAQRMLDQGAIDHALVVGLELYNVTTLSGFYSMQLLSSGQIQPFDKFRSGMILGEACSAVVLSSVEDTTTRPSGELQISGGASLCDTSSVTTPDSDGDAIAEVIQAALFDAAVAPDEISSIKLHGTASAANDRAEAAGVNRVFTDTPTTFSMKPYIGHTLGACGVSELALLAATLDRGFIPATPGFEIPDPELNLAPIVENKHVSGRSHYLLNHFGFGGNNTVVVASHG